jgi:hypothetical protein
VVKGSVNTPWVVVKKVKTRDVTPLRGLLRKSAMA